MNLFNAGQSDPYSPQIDRRRLLLVIVLGAGILVTIILMAMVIFSSGSKDDFMRVVVRTQELQTLTDESKKRVRTSGLAKINSDASLLLSSDNVALLAQLTKQFGESNVSSDFRKNEADTTIEDKLKQAELLDKFDVTYRNLLIEKLNRLIPLAEKSKTDIGGSEFTTVMNTFITNLQTIRSQLEGVSL